MNRLALAFLAGGITLCAQTGLASANEFAPQIKEILDTKLMAWTKEPAVIEAIRKQNQAHAGLDAAKIDELDKDWRAQAKAGGGPLVDDLLNRAASKYLGKMKSGVNGLVSEVFVMDNKGLNVAQSDVTSDYMQGDEAKWKKTYPVGSDAVFIDEVEFDDSSETFQCQVSVTITDPATGKPIGAATFGINIEELS